MSKAPAKEHEFKASVVEDIYYPDHTRVSTPTFERTKHEGHARGDVCAISGRRMGLEYHHMICEDAFTDSIDWATVRGVALGEITVLPVLHPDTDLPTGETFNAKQSLLWALLQITIIRGFDWRAFDPAKPETFVDAAQNMLVLGEKYHRARIHGIHGSSWPIWVRQAFPSTPGYVFSPDELAARMVPA